MRTTRKRQRGKRPRTAWLGALSICGLLAFGFWAGCGEDEVETSSRVSALTPTTVNGNPNCASEGLGSFELTIDYAGTYDLDATNQITVDFINVAMGQLVDFDSDITLDGIIIKAGPKANVYTFDPELDHGTGLEPPLNTKNGKYFGISHISICYDYELAVEKTADTTFTRTHEWDIQKTVTPSSWSLFNGDTGTSMYTVAVDHTGYVDSDWGVSGTITILNPSPGPASLTGVSDTISDGISASVDCGVSFPHELAAGGTLECTYASSLPDGTNRLNTATVTTSGDVDGNSGTADVTFGLPTTEVNSTVDVEDTNGLGWTFAGDASVSYARTFACEDDEGTHNNTATITQTGDSDQAAVTVECHSLTVTKTAIPSVTQIYDWIIDKRVSETTLEIEEGDSAEVLYTIQITRSAPLSDWGVSGEIDVQNPAGAPTAVLLSVADIISPDIAATVDCGVTFPHELPAGTTLTCTYEADLPDGASRTNTATATRQTHDYTVGGPTASGSTDYQGTAPVTFITTTAAVSGSSSITVTDSQTGSLGTFEDSATVTYSRTFECPGDEGEHPNTATINETGDSDAADVTVICIEVTEGCTPGFWKVLVHWDAWDETAYDTSDLVTDVFSEAAGLVDPGATLVQSLHWDAVSMTKALLRAATAALLNASHPDVDYPLTEAEIITQVNAAIASGSRSEMEDLKDQLDEHNNQGSPICD